MSSCVSFRVLLVTSTLVFIAHCLPTPELQTKRAHKLFSQDMSMVTPPWIPLTASDGSKGDGVKPEQLSEEEKGRLRRDILVPNPGPGVPELDASNDPVSPKSTQNTTATPEPFILQPMFYKCVTCASFFSRPHLMLKCYRRKFSAEPHFNSFMRKSQRLRKNPGYVNDLWSFVLLLCPFTSVDDELQHKGLLIKS